MTLFPGVALVTGAASGMLNSPVSYSSLQFAFQYERLYTSYVDLNPGIGRATAISVTNLFLCPMPPAPYFTGRENETCSRLSLGSLASKEAGY
jgi:hypothetical protein